MKAAIIYAVEFAVATLLVWIDQRAFLIYAFMVLMWFGND